MHSYLQFADRIEQAAEAVLGTQPGTHRIGEWCDQFRAQVASIEESRGIAIPSIAAVGAKGQGKTWLVRQFISDPRIADLLPSGVLSSEATTQLYWIGPQSPEGLDPSKEVYLHCKRESMLDLQIPYLLVDSPGVTDEHTQAAKIAQEALTLSPIKLLVVRRDQLRGAVLGGLALFTEGAICIPVVTCIPIRELRNVHSTELESPNEPAAADFGASLRNDLELFEKSLRSFAPGTKFLTPILLEDFEATGEESNCGERFRCTIQSRLQNESLEQIAATRTRRMEAVRERLRSSVSGYVQENLSPLAAALRKLHQEADSLPTQSLASVLGSSDELNVAIRGRMRAHILTNTGLVWFPYRTLLSILGFTTGAWDRLFLSFTGSLPSIFGTFLSWAKNLSKDRSAMHELHEGIRLRLNRQIEDRLQPIQESFYRSVYRLRGDVRRGHEAESTLRIRLNGVDELQNRARTTFEWCVDRELPSRFSLQFFGAIGTLLFWVFMAGPIVAIYRTYIFASWDTLANQSDSVSRFEIGSGILVSSVVLSVLPLLIYCMLVFSWLQRGSRVRKIAQITIAAEHQLLEELRSTGVLRLRYEDPLLEQAEFLVQL